jgi:hypothetical protein
MKQRITVEQLQQLTEEQQQRFREWWKPSIGDAFTNYYADFGWTYNNIVGGCKGYWNCESVIDDGDNPSEQPDEDSLPLLNIGQMIELLENKNPSLKIENNYYDEIDPDSFIWGVDGKRADNFCDALWNAVKKVL